MLVSLRCISVVYGFDDVEGEPGKKVKTSETASFGDAEVPLDEVRDRRCCAHVHCNAPELLGQFEVDKVYTFAITE